ncbi:MAG: tripartite tricarboxylate transporter substrate binding protein [Deltaproteobacteria bacterium]|nr:tripartite tricarboxylate transporter substrate binding protein [Deltaproteobacteria bacterium]MBW1960346.1 tripartite tricarboxylate transporter substrate binding protein [Deltaproteobacteria bacterium]MBW2152582.1 tripartite tricarboxylate transporter substrate binding protein [Deltaproteobacteria bacterium]
MLAQLIGDEMGKILGQRFLVVNKPGGSGATGALYVKKAKPDGYTILQAWIAPFVMVPIRNPKVKYDPLKDFDLLAYATENPVTALALKDKPYDTVREFVDYVKKNPNRIYKFGCGGAMSVHCIFGNQVFHQAGVKVQGIYYQAASKSLPDLLGGNLDLTFSNFQALAQYENVKALGVFSSQRVKEFKQVPTIKEQGFDAPVTASWSGFAAPKGLPPEVKKKLVETLRTVLTDEAIKKRIFDNLYQFVTYRDPEGFRKIIERDLKTMRGPVEQIMEMQKKKK